MGLHIGILESAILLQATRKDSLLDAGVEVEGQPATTRLVNNQAACKRLINSLITINPIKLSSPILIF